MLHCDEETLSLLALGEPGPAAAEAHLAECERCRGELSALQHVVRTARTTGHGHHPVNPVATHDADHFDDPWDDESLDLDHVVRIVPPFRVWDEIAAHTGVRAVPNLVPAAAPEPPPTTPPVEAKPVAEVEPVAEAEPVVDSEPRPMRPAAGPALPAQRSRASWLNPRMFAVAAGCLAIGLLAGVIGTRWLSDSSGPASTSVVASTPLAGLPAAPTASGQADVTGSGQSRTLDLDVRKLGAPNGFYEVWLIDPTVTKMVPIGVLSGSHGRFSLPAGVNLADYPLVDVSIEPLDGNPAHSGKSVLRGTLRS